MFLFLGLAIVTDDYFVASLDRICEQLRLSDDVAGATFLAAGSSAPELFTSLISVFVTKDEVGVGTIVGSAVFNVLVIIGSAAALAGSVLHLDWRPLVRDSFFYFVFIALLFMSLVVTSRSDATWYEGLILVLAYGGYIAFMKWGNKPYMRAAQKWSGGRRARAAARAGTPNGDVEGGAAAAAVPPPPPAARARRRRRAAATRPTRLGRPSPTAALPPRPGAPAARRRASPPTWPRGACA
ncbi:hypothetical protein BU14_0286s0024 [Porphyra umbilicalis]|uniref:Sodium/calcium exchanger membrane region domain-containing protein n=1 Tax=Porphyra umbilicalis TaxID=2786 RepID=A0A1X6P0V3_PORUM|nr:hypothetical protein BU14_0286s0024 [Porphyra umbilicalis]|eukprot:OSX74511.1 hypothetical protein BU14_0286s0024 [Porphyra umbilicalis]